jgi:hypothetical protein
MLLLLWGWQVLLLHLLQLLWLHELLQVLHSSRQLPQQLR